MKQNLLNIIKEFDPVFIMNQMIFDVYMINLLPLDVFCKAKPQNMCFDDIQATRLNTQKQLGYNNF